MNKKLWKKNHTHYIVLIYGSAIYCAFMANWFMYYLPNKDESYIYIHKY